ILIAHALPKTMDPKKIAAMAAAIVGTSEMAVVEMGLGTCNSSIVDTHIGKMIATGAGEEAILVTMVRNEANMGLLLLTVGRPVRAPDHRVRRREAPQPRRGGGGAPGGPRVRRRESRARPPGDGTSGEAGGEDPAGQCGMTGFRGDAHAHD